MKTLICGLNWIGDSLMAFPAITAFKAQHPDDQVSVLVKGKLAPLWSMHPARLDIIGFESTHTGSLRAGFTLRARHFDRCFILPNSFRSAWLPWLAGVPRRIGRSGGWRNWLLTQQIPVDDDAIQHQQLEYFELLAPREAVRATPPQLEIPVAAMEQARILLPDSDSPYVAVLPGAARGPSKQWPADRFVAVARRLAENGAKIVLCGSTKEIDLCAGMADTLGSSAINLAGKTDLPVWAAVLARCRTVLCNDSGGMHLAAAVGTPLVAIFGRTDPRRTGPLGGRATILQAPGKRERDIARDDPAAVEALATITVDQVYAAAREHLR